MFGLGWYSVFLFFYLFYPPKIYFGVHWHQEYILVIILLIIRDTVSHNYLFSLFFIKPPKVVPWRYTLLHNICCSPRLYVLDYFLLLLSLLCKYILSNILSPHEYCNFYFQPNQRIIFYNNQTINFFVLISLWTTIHRSNQDW